MFVMKTEKPLTTFQTAKICQVFHTTIINWVNQGILKAYYTPGGHRRIHPDDLIEFMRKHEMPIPQHFLNRQKNVLIVEDDPAVQRLLTRALQPLQDLQTQTCSNGLEALIMIGKEAPDLVILDLNIPEIDGLKVCRLLKANENTQDIRIIAISGETLSPAEEKTVKTNADCFFHKPLPTAELRSRVAEFLELEVPDTQNAPGR